jgi:simple sugar transport system permease protein
VSASRVRATRPTTPLRAARTVAVWSSVILGTGVLAVGALAALLLAGGYDAERALRALWEGSLGSSYAFLSATLVRATPLILSGLAVTLAFTAGVLNIGAEGQLLAGAAAAAAIGVLWGGTVGAATPVLALLAGALAGSLWAVPAAYLRRRFGVLEVISTIMLNFLAVYLVGYLVRGPLQEPLHIYPQTETLPSVAQLPKLVPGSRLHVGFALAVTLAVALWWTLQRTAAGFRLRVSGASPSAAASAALVDVARATSAAFLASGAIAGLAGAVEVTGVTYALYENISPGYGYTAIAVALLARLNPLAVVASGIVFGALEAGASAMQRDAAVPSVIVSVVEALVILLLLAMSRLRLEVGAATWWDRGGTRTPAGERADAPEGAT